MKKQLSIRDWQVLSAFLDDNLSAQEKTRLESKLTSDADLQEALEDLRRTRILLRNSPRLKAPRNFILTSQMVGIEKHNRSSIFFPIFKFSTVIASILFIFALLGDFVVKQPLQRAVVQERVMVATEQSSEAPGLEKEIMLIPTATIYPAEEMMVTEEAVRKEPSQLSNSPIEPLPSTIPSLMKIVPTPTVVEMPQLAAVPAESDSSPSEVAAPLFEDAGEEQTTEEIPMEDTAAKDMGEQVMRENDEVVEHNNIEAPVYGITGEAEPKAAYQKGIIWRVLEIVFGGLIFISGILALIFKSKKTS